MRLSDITSDATSIDRSKLKPCRTKRRRLVLDVTFKCDMSCHNCCKQCSQAPSDDRMDVGQVQKMLNECEVDGRYWDSIRVSGGEPTLHPEIGEILHALKSLESQLVVMTNFTERAYGVLSSIDLGEKEFFIRPDPKSGSRQDFTPVNAAPCDFDEVSFEDAEYECGCQVASICGTCLNQHGYYSCVFMSGIDRVFGIGVAAMSLRELRKVALVQRRKLCRYCGQFWVNFFWNTFKEPIVSESWKEAFAKYRQSPPELERY